MEITYEVKKIAKEQSLIIAWGCFAQCCTRDYNKQSNGSW